MESPIENPVSPEFIARAERILDSRDKMIARIEALEEKKRSMANPKGGFSPVELLSHMGLVDQQYIELWHKTDRKKMGSDVGNPNFIYKMVLKRMQTATASPAAKPFRPRVAPLVEQGKEHWVRTSNELLGLLSTLRSPNLVAIKHPLFGKMSALDILALTEAHHHYHYIRFPW